jgi:hypothetical protein
MLKPFSVSASVNTFLSVKRLITVENLCKDAKWLKLEIRTTSGIKGTRN